MLAAVSLLFLAPAALARKSDFAFTMQYRVVNGKENKIIHTLASGTLTVSGSLWVTNVDPVAVGPYDVRIVVNEIGEGFFAPDREVCTIIVTPSPLKGQAVPFNGSCGSISGSLYVVAFKVNDDGRDIRAAGVLATESRF